MLVGCLRNWAWRHSLRSYDFRLQRCLWVCGARVCRRLAIVVTDWFAFLCWPWKWSVTARSFFCNRCFWRNGHHAGDWQLHGSIYCSNCIVWSRFTFDVFEFFVASWFADLLVNRVWNLWIQFFDNLLFHRLSVGWCILVSSTTTIHTSVSEFVVCSI